MAEEKDENIETETQAKKPTRRQIIIETDGNNVFLMKAEVGGKIELIGVLNTLVSYLSIQK